MNSLIFGATVGVVVGFSGASITEQPIKTVALMLALIVAHEFTKGKS